jgi:hypothetical protein
MVRCAQRKDCLCFASGTMCTAARGFTRMGLASQFGDQANYKCKSCGYTMALYAPCCPRCLDTELIKTEKVQGKFKNTVSEESRETPKQGHPVVPFVVAAIVLVIGLAVSNRFAPPRPESITRTEPAPNIGGTAKPRASARVSNNQSSKRTKRSNARSAKAPGSSTASSSAARPATPMKLWEASSDDE